MKEAIESMAIWGLFGLIFAFIFTFAVSFFSQIFFEQSTESITGSIEAFTGAFFAFLFLRLGDGLTKIYERQIKHYNAMVELEFVLNQNLQEIAKNIFIIGIFLENLDISKRQNTVIENPQRLGKIHVRHDLLLRLYGKDLINKLFAYFVSLDSMNYDMETVNRFYEKVLEKSFSVQKKEIYTQNIPEMEGHFKLCEKFLAKFREQTEDLLVRVRVGMKRKPLLTKIMFFVSRGYGEIDEGEIVKEKEKLVAEFRSVREKSKKEMESILR